MIELIRHRCAALSAFMAGAFIVPPPAEGSPGESEERRGVSVLVSGAWQSHYVSEGRDNLAGGDLLSATLETGWRGVIAGAWYAREPDGIFDELDLFVAYPFSIRQFDCYLSYTHLRFFEDLFHDNEIAAGVAWNDAFSTSLTAALDARYSFDAGRAILDGKGWFFDLSLSREFAVGKRWLVIPSAVLGINSGYVSLGHDGLNHVEVRIDFTFAVTDRVELGGYVAWNRAIGADPMNHLADILLQDLVHGGAATTLRF